MKFSTFAVLVFGGCAALTGCTADVDDDAELSAEDSASALTSFDSGDFTSSNLPWSSLKPLLDLSDSCTGSVKGTRENVNNAAVETTSVGNRSFLSGFRIHIPTCSSVSFTNRDKFTRWYQEDGNTQVFRLLAGDENVQSSRPGAARSEAFGGGSWTYSDNRTYIFSARYTITQLPAGEGVAIFQAKAPSPEDWGVQLNVGSTGTLTINERREADTVALRDVIGKSFNVEVRDDGRNYRVSIDGVEKARGSYARNLATTFRWGMYCGGVTETSDGKITSGTAVTYVSGARVSSVAGRLN